MRITKCKTCQGDIVWCKTPKDKSMPINASAAAFGGNIVMLDPDNDTPLIRVLKKGEAPPPGSPRYKSHFTTCKDAAQHRIQHCATCGKVKDGNAPFGENCECPF